MTSHRREARGLCHVRDWRRMKSLFRQMFETSDLWQRSIEGNIPVFECHNSF